MKQYLNILLSLFLAVTSAQPAFAQTKVDGSLLKGDVIGGTASNTRRIVVPKDTKANLDAKTRLEANLVYGTDTKKAYIDNGTDLIAVGSGSGGAVNLITDGDAENATSSIFVPYNDAAASRPVDGVGSSADVTTAITSTAPLTGAKSFTITKDAANRQGQGWSIPFTVPLSMQAKVLQIEVDYIVNSGTFVAGTSSADSDVIWYLYDVTNSQLIEPSSIKLLSSSSTLSDKFRSTFQTSATGTSYRLIAHVATTSAAAYSLKVEASVSPSVYVYGTPVTDWQAYTPTYVGFGTVSASVAYWRRVGDSIEIAATMTAGTVTASTASFSLPNGLTVDPAKTSTAAKEVGTWIRSSEAVSSSRKRGLMLAISTSGNTVNFGNDDYAQGVAPTVSQAGNTIISNGQTLTVSIKDLAIQGWSSSVQMSDSADTRLMTARYKTAAGQSIPNSTFTIVDFGTKDFDTHGLVTTGASWKFTSNISGYFRVSTHIRAGSALNAVNFAARVYKNGAAGPAIADTSTDNSASGRGDVTGSTIIQMVAGDYFDIRVIQNSGGAITLLNDADYVYVDIEKLSGPSAIAASESINLRYTTAAGQTINNTSPTVVFGTKVYDSHSSFNATTGVFTAPIAGKYRVSVKITSTATAFTTGQDFECILFKNGSAYSELGRSWGNGSSINLHAGGSDSVDMLAGQTLTIIGYTSTTTTLLTNALSNYISIERIGN